ncbi:MAG: AHH domain-containing protein, partial [Clostridium septicum]
AKSIMGYLPEIANKIKNGERVEKIVDSIRGAKGAAEAVSKLKYTLKYSIDELAFQIKKVVSLGDVTVVELGNGITYAIRETDDVAEAARPAYREVIQGIWKYSGKTADEIADFYFSKVANKTKVSGKFSGSASDILRAELKDAGVITPPYKHQAHHIIPEGMDVPELNEVRAIMQRYGVDLNSASNGVFLPDAPDLPYAGSETVHRGSHTADYARYVAKAIIDVKPQSADDIVDVLNNLRKKLLNGTLKLNSL